MSKISRAEQQTLAYRVNPQGHDEQNPFLFHQLILMVSQKWEGLLCKNFRHFRQLHIFNVVNIPIFFLT